MLAEWPQLPRVRLAVRLLRGSIFCGDSDGLKVSDVLACAVLEQHESNRMSRFSTNLNTYFPDQPFFQNDIFYW